MSLHTLSYKQLPFARLTGLMSLQMYLFGGVVTSWTQPSGDEVLFVRPDAKFDKSKPISGGIPHCFPQVNSCLMNMLMADTACLRLQQGSSGLRYTHLRPHISCPTWDLTWTMQSAVQQPGEMQTHAIVSLSL